MKKLLLLIMGCILLQSLTYAQTEIWGVTSGDGISNFGIIFKTDEAGNNFTIQKKFTSAEEGDRPQQLMQASNGMLYGITSKGGLYGKGVLYQYNPVSNIFTKKHDFVDSSGSYPVGTLTEGNDKMLYGVTGDGGANDKGVVYMFNPVTSHYLKKQDIGNFGSEVSGSSISLVKAADGTFYGAGSYIFPSGDISGKFFKFDPVTSIITDQAGGYGEFPYDIIKVFDTAFYAPTYMSLLSDFIVNYNPITNNRRIVYSMLNRKHICSSLVQVSDSILYGISRDGRMAALPRGYLFQFNIKDSVYTENLQFGEAYNTFMNSSNLLYMPNKNLYGLVFRYIIDTSSFSGEYETTLFEFNPATGKNTVKHQLHLNDSTNFGGSGKLTKVNTNPNGITQKENEINEILVYPNPTNGLFTVKFDTDIKEASTIKVINMLGKTIMLLKKQVGSTFTIDLANQPNGMYFLEVNENNNSYNIKIIKN